MWAVFGWFVWQCRHCETPRKHARQTVVMQALLQLQRSGQTPCMVMRLAQSSKISCKLNVAEHFQAVKNKQGWQVPPKKEA